MTPRARGARAAAIALALVLGAALAVVPLVVGGGGSPRAGSSASTAPEGRRAAFLVLERLGLAPRVWDRRPGLLPQEPALVWLAKAPGWSSAGGAEEGEPSRPPADDPLLGARAAGLSAPRHYRAFVERGGTLAIPWSERAGAFLADGLGLEALASVRLAELEQRVQGARPAGGRELRVDLPPAALVVPPLAELSAERLLTDPAQRPLAIRIPLGRGAVVLLADDRFLDNDRIGRAEHGLVWVRLVESLARGAPVLFDEHALGRGSYGSLLGLVVGPRGWLASLHLGLLLLALVWRLAWPREFARDPPPLEQVSDLARARAQAGLWTRAGRFDLLAEGLRAGTLRRAPRGAALAPAEAETGPEPCRRQAELLAIAAGRADRAGSWREVLCERAVSSAQDLVRLDADLRTLEGELAAGGFATRAAGRQNAPARGALVARAES